MIKKTKTFKILTVILVLSLVTACGVYSIINYNRESMFSWETVCRQHHYSVNDEYQYKTLGYLDGVYIDYFDMNNELKHETAGIVGLSKGSSSTMSNREVAELYFDEYNKIQRTEIVSLEENLFKKYTKASNDIEVVKKYITKTMNKKYSDKLECVNIEKIYADDINDDEVIGWTFEFQSDKFDDNHLFVTKYIDRIYIKK